MSGGPAPPRSVKRSFSSGRFLRRLGLTALVAANIVGLVAVFMVFLMGNVGVDWVVFEEAGRRVLSGRLYEFDVVDGVSYNYLYSPLLAYAFTVPVGLAPWLALHFAVLLTLPRQLMLLTLVTFPFWLDLYNAGVMVFLFVAAWHAVHGSRLGVFCFFALCLLVPRPVLLPAFAWILWKQRASRLPFLGMLAAYGVALLASGWGTEWIITVLTQGALYTGVDRDFGPTRVFGPAWIPVGLVVAAWLTYHGRIGFASIPVAPYWTPQYAMMLLLEMRHSDQARRVAEDEA